MKLGKVGVLLFCTLFSCVAFSAIFTKKSETKKSLDASTVQNHAALIVRCKQLNESCALAKVPTKECSKELPKCKTEMEKSLKSLIDSR